MADAEMQHDESRPPWAQDVAHDIVGLRTLIANLFFVGEPGAQTDWVLVDTGLGHCADLIAGAAAERFGAGAKPKAIILTHGHFDHVGAVQELADRWDVPVYAHELELPYLTGRSDYPPGDPTVGGGANAGRRFCIHASLLISARACAPCPKTAACHICPAGAGRTRRATRPATFRFSATPARC